MVDVPSRDEFNALTTRVTKLEGAAPPQPNAIGPVAVSPGGFLTVDFAQAFNYPNGGSGQQTVSRKIWGTSTGGAGDGNFRIYSNSDFQRLMSQMSPGLIYFKNSGQAYWNADGSINQSVLHNLLDGWPAADPQGVTSVVIGCDWSQAGADGNPSLFAQRMAALAKFLINYKLSNGRTFPLIGVMGQDEPDSQGEATVANYYAALRPAIKAMSADLQIVGPNCSYIQWVDFPYVDVFSYDYYTSGNPYLCDDLSAVNNNLFASIGDTASKANAAARAVMLGGYNQDWNCQAQCHNSYGGALFVARGVINTLNHTNREAWACVWDAYADGTCGMITGSTTQANQYYGVTNVMQLSPKAYLTARGAANITGPRWQVTANATQLDAVAVTPGPGRCAAMFVNVGKGQQSGKQLALSHWPTSGDGNGTINVWQMGSSVKLPGTDGSLVTRAVKAGIVDPVDFPDPSVTLFWT